MANFCFTVGNNLSSNFGHSLLLPIADSTADCTSCELAFMRLLGLYSSTWPLFVYLAFIVYVALVSHPPRVESFYSSLNFVRILSLVLADNKNCFLKRSSLIAKSIHRTNVRQSLNEISKKMSRTTILKNHQN